MPGTTPPETRVSKFLVLLLATASGAVVANLYYNQPLLAAISHDLKFPESRAGLIPMMAQAGYGLGLLFIAPLGDILERRRLIVTMVFLAAVALALTATVKTAPVLTGRLAWARAGWRGVCLLGILFMAVGLLAECVFAQHAKGGREK